MNYTLLYAQNLKLEITAIDSIETNTINSLDIETSFLNYSLLKNEIDLTVLKLYKIGYLENKLISIKKENDSVFEAKFHLNKKYDSIYIYYDQAHITEKLLRQVSGIVTPKYFLIDISKSEEVLNLLNKKVSEEGKPFVSFQLENISKKDNDNLQANLVVNSTNKRTIDDIVIKGYENFPKSYLKRFLKIKRNQSFNLTDIKLKTEVLQNLPFAQQIKNPEILFSKDSTTLYLYLEKSKSNSFDGFLGFGNNEYTNKIEFAGYLNLNLINNLNFGETFNLIYKSDDDEQRTFKINTSLPYLFKSPIGLNLNLNIFKKDSTFSIVNQSAKLFYQINAKNKISGGISAIKSDHLLNSNNELIKDYNSTFITTSFEYNNNSNNYLFPLKSYFFIEGSTGKREMDNINHNQTSISFKTFKIFNLNNKNKVFVNLNGETLLSDNFLTNELKRFGGINSIRGFEENSLLASLYTVVNSEYRYLLSNNIYLHSIMDAAYYENDINQIKEKLFGFGFGIGILTKAGLFKFNYANGLIENQPFKLNNSKIHISLNAMF